MNEYANEVGRQVASALPGYAVSQSYDDTGVVTIKVRPAAEAEEAALPFRFPPGLSGEDIAKRVDVVKFEVVKAWPNP